MVTIQTDIDIEILSAVDVLSNIPDFTQPSQAIHRLVARSRTTTKTALHPMRHSNTPPLNQPSHLPSIITTFTNQHYIHASDTNPSLLSPSLLQNTAASSHETKVHVLPYQTDSQSTRRQLHASSSSIEGKAHQPTRQPTEPSAASFHIPTSDT